MNEENAKIDRQLLQQIVGRDRTAFASFYDRYSTVLFSVAVRILRDQKEAEDVLQDVFLQIWEKAENYKAHLGTPVNWTITLTRNKAIDRLRSSQRRHRLAEEFAGESESHSPLPQSGIIDTEKATMVRAAIKNLPTEQRQAIGLAYFGGLTQSEISESLNEPLGTIKARIRRGMLKLRELLEGAL
ncbi:MAG: sigma-70 family RNA polymerase sigma factor [Verrucomicrobiota bacterium]